MKAVIQRVLSASVAVESDCLWRIGHGLVILLGVAKNDQEQDVRSLVEKMASLRVFADDEGKMNRSILDVRGEVLVVSQFTLLAVTSQGRRPSFQEAAPPAHALSLYELTIEHLQRRGLVVATGRFGAHMRLSLVNDGPVTLILDTRAWREALR